MALAVLPLRRLLFRKNLFSCIFSYQAYFSSLANFLFTRYNPDRYSYRIVLMPLVRESARFPSRSQYMEMQAARVSTQSHSCAPLSTSRHIHVEAASTASTHSALDTREFFVSRFPMPHWCQTLGVLWYVSLRFRHNSGTSNRSLGQPFVGHLPPIVAQTRYRSRPRFRRILSGRSGLEAKRNFRCVSSAFVRRSR